MAKITREELLKIAKISRINLHEDEIEKLMEQLKSVLSYAECVNKISGDMITVSPKNINVYRPDIAQKSSSKRILAQAPQVEDNFFVVLPILDK